MPTDLDTVKAAILERGLTWSAGETSVSRFAMLPASAGNLFGLNIPEDQVGALVEDAKLHKSTFRAMAPPPAAVDWRNKGGRNYVTGIRNQGTCGSCVSFATCASLEARWCMKAEKNDPASIDLSEAHLFFCGCGPCCNSGWNFVPALTQAQKGIGREIDFPYVAGNQPCPRPQPHPVLAVSTWRAATSMLDRKQAIAERGPVIAGLRVYEDFYYYKSGIYRHVTGIFRGLHAVCVIGYNDEGKYWIVKNSWGTGWGDKGFIKIAYGQCELDTTYPFYDPDIVIGQHLVS